MQLPRCPRAMLLSAIAICALAAVRPAQADATGADEPAAAAAPNPPGPRPRKVIVEPPPPVPDSEARRQAEDANLDPVGPRHGVAAGIFFMGWQQVGSVDDAGRGGGVGLRLGASASSNTVIWLELVAGAFPDTSTQGCVTKRCLSYIESTAALIATGQRYVGPNLWLRGGAGFASYTQVVKMGTDRAETRAVDGGYAVAAGIGVDLVRRHTTRISLENMLTLHRFSSGWIFDVGVGLGVALY